MLDQASIYVTGAGQPQAKDKFLAGKRLFRAVSPDRTLGECLLPRKEERLCIGSKTTVSGRCILKDQLSDSSVSLPGHRQSLEQSFLLQLID